MTSAEAAGPLPSDPAICAESLERALGDPFANDAEGFREVLIADEAEAFPDAAFQALLRFGLSRYYVPVKDGGALFRLDTALALLRVVARRDITLAIAHGKTLLGSIAVWAAGNAEQRASLSRLVLSGGQVSLGLTERDHGADLGACSVTATREGAAYRLDGEKWLINNATRGAAITVLARTSAAQGPQAVSLFLVEKAALPKGTWAPIAKIRTLGVRGADISGLRFEGALVPESARIGAEGTGLSTALRSLQVTRTLCAGLSLGALDTALRLAASFARERHQYGAPILELPLVRAELADAFVDLLACESVTLGALRLAHLAPAQVAATSAVVKALVPATVESALARLATLLGARHYLREGLSGGIFQKILRDHALVPLFDGSTVVNLQSLGVQLPALCGAMVRPLAGSAQTEFNTSPNSPRVASVEAGERLRIAFDPGAPLPPFDMSGLSLAARGPEDVLHAEPSLPDSAPSQAREAARTVAEALREHRRRTLALAAAEGRRFARSVELFELSRDHAALHAAAACIHTFAHLPESAPPFAFQADWLAHAVQRLLSRFGGPRTMRDTERDARLTHALLGLSDAGLSFSLSPHRVSPAVAARP